MRYITREKLPVLSSNIWDCFSVCYSDPAATAMAGACHLCGHLTGYYEELNETFNQISQHLYDMHGI